MRQTLLACAVFAALLSAGCAVGPSGLPSGGVSLPFGDKTPPPPPVRVGEDATTIGEAAMFAGISLTPIAITEDSRCPADVQCIQAGTARVSTQIITGGVSSIRVFTLGGPIVVGERTATLTGVCPAPRVQHTVLPREPVVIYAVSEAGAPTPPAAVCPEPTAPAKSAFDRLLGR